MPGRPITDQQMRCYMTLRTRHTRATAAAMAGFSASTGYRVESYGRNAHCCAPPAQIRTWSLNHPAPTSGA